MRIVACIKAAPEDQDIHVAPDRTLDLSRAAWKVGAYDLNAVEAGRRLVDEVGGELVGLSMGGEALAATKLRKDVLSRGLDRLVVVAGDPAGDALQTATALAAAVNEIGDVDLVLLGAGSADRYAQQVGTVLGALLGRPTLNAVDHLEVQRDHVRVERLLEDGVQVVDVPLPAVLAVTSGINTPRIAGMKDILAAGKKPVLEVTPPVGAPAATTRTVSVLAPEQKDRGRVLVEGTATEVAQQLAQFLKAL
ncbi:putative electron transfer flavoprotein FixA [Cellulomonas citrea]|uniref:putative electron transfer flavoprotein FixA n=1 Tax=Cellulomonas citrea TaxID=1909423 RepID=UPI00135C6910|nr:putative electron transfer flavoprotein FixA [Cellulomonas citrea]